MSIHNPSVKLKLLQTMIRIRCFEETVASNKELGFIQGPVHTCIGEEAVDVGVCLALREKDYIIGNHRSHGYMLAKGANMNLLMAEIYGKSTGASSGKGGSMHVNDRSIGGLGASAIVGSGLPIACGSGFASRYFSDDHITCVFFGDGAAHEGVFHESMNLASVWKLPIVFVLVNNKLAVTTKLEQTSISEDFYPKATSYGIPSYVVDGQNVEEVYTVMSEIVKYIRDMRGPVLLEAKTIRFREHQEGLGYKKISASGYRNNQQLESDMKKRDPITLYMDKLIQSGLLTIADFEAIQYSELENIKNAVDFANSSPEPQISDAYKNVFSDGAVK